MKLFKSIIKSFRDEDVRDGQHAQAHGGANNNANQAGPSRLRNTSRPASNQDTAIDRSNALLLSHLRVGREADHDLVSIPVTQELGGREPVTIADPATDHLSGIPYIEHLTTENRLLPTFQNLIADRLLPIARQRGTAIQNLMVKKLRLIASEAYRDPDLAMRLEDLALEYIPFCGDRAEYILSQLHGEALLANLRRGELDDVSLYNIGISFFRLDLVQQEAIKRRPEILNQQQSVHEFYELEWRLQDRLKLPFKHDPQMFPRNNHIATAGFVEEIATAVQQRCCRNDGEEAIAFMSKWEPWAAMVRNEPKNQLDLQSISDEFQKILDKYETNRTNPQKAEYRHNEKNVLDFMNKVMARREEWMREYTGQKAREFLVNHRACVVLDEGLSSSYLTR